MTTADALPEADMPSHDVYVLTLQLDERLHNALTAMREEYVGVYTRLCLPLRAQAVPATPQSLVGPCLTRDVVTYAPAKRRPPHLVPCPAGRSLRHGRRRPAERCRLSNPFQSDCSGARPSKVRLLFNQKLQLTTTQNNRHAPAPSLAHLPHLREFAKPMARAPHAAGPAEALAAHHDLKQDVAGGSDVHSCAGRIWF
jgi:hypothetical protein